jgi:hypothetical protein
LAGECLTVHRSGRSSGGGDLQGRIFESEAVEQRSLPQCSLAHHARIPTAAVRIESGLENDFNSFNGTDGKSVGRRNADVVRAAPEILNAKHEPAAPQSRARKQSLLRTDRRGHTAEAGASVFFGGFGHKQHRLYVAPSARCTRSTLEHRGAAIMDIADLARHSSAVAAEGAIVQVPWTT